MRRDFVNTFRYGELSTTPRPHLRCPRRPTRRAILVQLEHKSSASVGELAEPFAIKLPAVMKHLSVLADAGLITRTKSGRTVTVRLRPQPMREAMAWLSRYERFWAGSLDRLAAYAERKETEPRGKEE